MGSKDLLKSSLTRRTFVKGMAAAGALVTVAGCSSDDGSGVTISSGTGGATVSSQDEFANAKSTYRYGTSAHNCGGRCIIRAQVVDGKIVRFLTDESVATANNDVIEMENRNCTQSRACSKCRSYKMRLYHPGRLKYPLKQTKTRGDLSGFVRVSWETALNELSRKYKAITDKYGPETVHSIYACGNIASGWQGGGYTGIWNGFSSIPSRLMGGFTAYTNDYSFHQSSFFGGYTGYPGATDTSANAAATVGKNVVLWGSNILSTVNPVAYSWIKGVEDFKKRSDSGKVYFIGPEFSDMGVTLADEWLQIRPYTDNAIIMAMLHEMIINTFNEDGSIKTDAWLDVDYLDTMVYGFFDNPEYWVAYNAPVNYIKGTDSTITDKEVATGLTQDTGQIEFSEAALGDSKASEWNAKSGYWHWDKDNLGAISTDSNAYRSSTHNRTYTRWQNVADPSIYAYSQPFTTIKKVESTEGKSLATYIMGSDDRLTKALYNDTDAKAYVAKRFATNSAIAARAQTSQYNTPANTKFEYKKQFNVPKTAAWASAISGMTEAKIKELARLYSDTNNHPIWSEWSGGQMKQSEGVITKFSMDTLMIVTKCWGQAANGYSRRGFNVSSTAAGSSVGPSDTRVIPNNIQNVVPSVTQWHNAIKMAFGDQLKAAGYTGKYIPDWGEANIGNGKVYHDDGGAKALVKWKRDDTGKIEVRPDGYYQWETDGSGNPIYSGFRFIINSAGNIPINQHMNCNDSREMYEKLPIAFGNADDAETFCLVTFDNFLAPSARWSDYVLPAATTWEQEDYINMWSGGNLYIPVVSAPPGESKSTWNFTNEFLKAYEKVDTSKAGIATIFTGGKADQQIEDLVKANFETAKANPTSPYYNKTWEYFLDNAYLPDKPTAADEAINGDSTLRKAVDAYLKSADLSTKPVLHFVATADGYSTGYGHLGGNNFVDPSACPAQSGRFHVFSGALRWRYENRYDKFHGFITDANQRGQYKTGDSENQPVVWEIPMYYSYQDYFREAYNLADTAALNGRYLLTTTHDRHRAHSSQSENPYLRELTHRTVGKGLYSGNDYQNYAMIDGQADNKALDTLNRTIGANGLPVAGKENVASYSEIWINPDNTEQIKDGDLVEVWNEIGAVRCVARTSYRCVPGFLGLHQGCWYDPREIDSKTVDVGGNCNTLMATKPSRADHGNAQQSAMVQIKKIAVQA